MTERDTPMSTTPFEMRDEPTEREWVVTHIVNQIIRARTPELAEKIGRRALLEGDSLWWPAVAAPGTVKEYIDD